MFRPPARPPAVGTRPEWELLRSSARSVVDAGDSERIRRLAGSDLDWDRLVELASHHHVMPLLYRSLSTVCPDAVPAALLDQLAREFSRNVARNLALASELLEVLKWLAAEDIPAIPFKGPTLASLAYGGLALRQAGDLAWDLVMRKARAIGAERMLALGLLLAVDLLGTPLGEAITRRIAADAMANKLAREVLEGYRREMDGPPPFAEWWNFNVRARESRRDRLRCRLKLLVPAFRPDQRDFDFWHLPPRLSFLYRGLKPLRLVREYASNPSGLLRLIGGLLGL